MRPLEQGVPNDLGLNGLPSASVIRVGVKTNGGAVSVSGASSRQRVAVLSNPHAQARPRESTANEIPGPVAIERMPRSPFRHATAVGGYEAAGNVYRFIRSICPTYS